MKSSFTLATVLATLSYRVAAHGIVTKITIGTKTYQGYDPNFQYMPTPPAVIGWTAPATQDRGPVDGTALNNPDIICQRGATNAKLSAPVAAGDSVSLQWTPWPESHKGPMLDYLADCGGDCSTVDKTTLKFFKIDAVGMTSTSGTPSTYGDDVMIAQNNTWTVKIPAGIKAGNYVLRHETIALHQAQGVGGAQPYPQCVNLQVTGGGSDTPAGVLGTQLYTSSEPGIQFNIYQAFQSTGAYSIPGPPLYSGAASGGSPPAANPPSPTAITSVSATSSAVKVPVTPTTSTIAENAPSTPTATTSPVSVPAASPPTQPQSGASPVACQAFIYLNGAKTKRDGVVPVAFQA